MPGRREHSGASPRIRYTAGAAALALTGTALAVALLPASSAEAKAPAANYHPGSDSAVFTVTGVEDSNCLISTGGSTVYIKPGDRIDFSSGLAGLSLGGLNLQGGQIAGLDVKARIDGGAKKGGTSFSVPAGKTVKIKNLSSGTHKLAWSATSVSIAVPAVTKTVTGLLGKILHKTIPAHTLTVPLSNSELKSGAQLSWTGKIHVVPTAAKCTVSVQTPKTKISAGPIHVTVPGQKVTVPGVTVPTSIPGVPNLTTPGSNSGGTKGTKSTTTPSTGGSYQPPIVSVPQMVVPKGNNANIYGSGGGYDLGVGTDNGTAKQLTTGGSNASTKSTGSKTGSGTSGTTDAGTDGKPKTVDLASNDSGQSVSAQLPVLLAIIAVIALAIVAGTYARLYLLGRKK